MKPSCLFSAVPWILIGALSAQAVTPGSTPSNPTVPPASTGSTAPSPASTSSNNPVASPPETSAQGGPTVSEFRAAFAGSPTRKVDPITFERLVSLNAGHGRLLSGPALAAAVASGPAASGTATPGTAGTTARVNPEGDASHAARTGPASATCDSLLPAPRTRCLDSLRASTPNAGHGLVPPPPLEGSSPILSDSASVGPRALREMQARQRAATPVKDTLILSRPEKGYESDQTSVEEVERTNWFINFFADLGDDNGHGGGLSGHDWAAIIYVVVGVVVVGAFVIYGIQTLAELAINRDDDPLFMEAGLRLSYSGKALQDPDGRGDLYRDAYLAGLRFAIGFDRPGMGIGITAEGGYIDVFLRGMTDPTRTFDFRGGYLVAGPMLRFGDNTPWSFSLEFLNGTSNHESIGWISKSRMTLEAKVASHTLVGAHLGAVFYDLHFLDGLGWRRGDFNRDLSLVYGLDLGWEF